ncbi:KR domain-containing protein [Stigmatella aurantiaca]|uniref:KR domain-containing protein n=1 Tax=Stigmatella aurantiaca TaxID=41 RepID=UPI001EE68450|nr:KR domain-containing protein [Stigmatella aurantiaca]
MSSLLGALGQVDYAAVSAFLDAYAESKRGLPGRRTVSIDWDRWLEVGAAMRRGLGLTPGQPGAMGLRRTAPGVYTARWRAESAWWLDEHRLDGVATLPGVAYLELVRAALELEHGPAPLESLGPRCQELFPPRSMRCQQYQQLDGKRVDPNADGGVKRAGHRGAHARA